MCADDSGGGVGVWTQQQGQGVVTMTPTMGLKHHLDTEKHTHTGERLIRISEGT